MLYKFQDKYTIKQFPGWWRIENTIVTNALAEEYALASGEWFPLIEENKPTYNPEIQYLIHYYELEETFILKKWEIINILIEEEMTK